MGCFKVILEGNCFVMEVSGQCRAMGFYTTVNIAAKTSQEFTYELENALDVAIKKNKLSITNGPLRKSFCRIAKIYSVADQNSFHDSGGMTFFNESSLSTTVSIFVRIFFAAFKSRDMVNIRR